MPIPVLYPVHFLFFNVVFFQATQKLKAMRSSPDDRSRVDDFLTAYKTRKDLETSLRKIAKEIFEQSCAVVVKSGNISSIWKIRATLASSSAENSIPLKDVYDYFVSLFHDRTSPLILLVRKFSTLVKIPPAYNFLLDFLLDFLLNLL